jgi:hypothetical protein
MSKLIVLPAFLKTFRTLVDNSVSIVFETQELVPDNYGTLGYAQGKSGVLVFKPDVDKLSKSELETIKMVDVRVMDEDKSKTPSQRLRSVLFILFKQDNKGFPDFDSYYINKMNSIVNFYKDKIED